MRTTLPRRTAKLMILGLFLIWTLFPIYWMFSLAIREKGELFGALNLLPQSFSLEHFVDLFETKAFGLSIANSLTVTLLPTLLPPVTVALIWQIMLSNNYGLLNNLLALFGLSPVNWLMDVNTAFYAILVIDIWQYTPFAFLLLYAAIDGAGKWSQFRFVTVPNIMRNIIMVSLLRVIDTFRLFDKVNILTKGGPANTTATITQYIYHNGVNMFKVGFASAASVVMTLIILILAAGYIRQNFKAREKTRR